MGMRRVLVERRLFTKKKKKKKKKQQNLRAKLLPLGQKKCSEKQNCLLLSIFLKFLLWGTTGRCGICCLSFFLLFSASCLLLSLSLGPCGPLGPRPIYPGPYPYWGTRGRKPRVPFPDRSGVPVRPNTEANCPNPQKLIVPNPRS